MPTSTGAPSQEQIEAAIQQTLVGWCAELDTGRKFWWGDWNRMIRDVIIAQRTGEPVLYDDDERLTRYLSESPTCLQQTSWPSRQIF